MTRLCPVLLTLCITLSASADAKEKRRIWQIAKVKSAEQRDASGFTFQFVGPLGYKTKVAWLYVMETESIVYEFLWPSEMPLHVTIQGDVKIAPGKGNTYYLLDDEGKERRLTLFKKTAKAKEGADSPRSAIAWRG